MPTLADQFVPKKLGYLVFYRGDSAPALALIKELRDKKEIAMPRDAAVFANDFEHCKCVILMHGVNDRDREKIVAVYGDLVEKPNQETVEALEEAESGGGEVHQGSSEEMIADIVAEQPRRRGRPRKTPLETAI